MFFRFRGNTPRPLLAFLHTKCSPPQTPIFRRFYGRGGGRSSPQNYLRFSLQIPPLFPPKSLRPLVVFFASKMQPAAGADVFKFFWAFLRGGAEPPKNQLRFLLQISPLFFAKLFNKGQYCTPRPLLAFLRIIQNATRRRRRFVGVFTGGVGGGALQKK